LKFSVFPEKFYLYPWNNQENTITLNTSGLPGGMYLVRIKKPDGEFLRKVIKL
jgi:hypothetical protein